MQPLIPLLYSLYLNCSFCSYCPLSDCALTVGWVEKSNDGGHVCQVENLENGLWQSDKEGSHRDCVGSHHTGWSDDTVINQWWGRIRSVPGNNTLPLIISATMQPTDHTSTGGGCLDDREVDMQTKWWWENKNTRTQKSTKTMKDKLRRRQTERQWCDGVWKWKWRACSISQVHQRKSNAVVDRQKWELTLY